MVLSIHRVLPALTVAAALLACDGSRGIKTSSDASAGIGVGGSALDAGTGGSAGAGGSSTEDAAEIAAVDAVTSSSFDTAAERATDVAGSADAGPLLDVGASSSVDTSKCDGAAMAGTWYRALDGLTMILAADGCSIRGTADNASFRHTIEGTYDEASRTMIGTIRRTSVSTACVTIMNATWVLTDVKHFTLAIVRTDGQCDIGKAYNEVSSFVRIGS